MAVSMTAQPDNFQGTCHTLLQATAHAGCKRVQRAVTSCCAGADSILPRQRQQLLEHLGRQLTSGSTERPAGSPLQQAQAASKCEAADASSPVGAAGVLAAPDDPLQAADAEAAQHGAQAGHRAEAAQPGVAGSCKGSAGSVSGGASGSEAGCDLTGDAVAWPGVDGAARSPVVARTEVRSMKGTAQQLSDKTPDQHATRLMILNKGVPQLEIC